MPARMTVRLTLGDGHLVAFIPLAGTFRLYLQPDGSFHEEDSHERRIPLFDSGDTFAGFADVESIVSAAIVAAADGDGSRADNLLTTVANDESVPAEIGRAVVEHIGGSEEAAEHRIAALARDSPPARIEAEVNTTGYLLLGTGRAESALGVFELNTRVFPEAFNTWDSLGEAHMTLGNDADAIRCYERSLELNPENANAEAMIARIREGAERPN
jgi:tetratricopeptide (TPR) repeat protein